MPLDVAEASPRGAPAPVQTALAREPARLKGGLELHYPEAMRRKGETATVLLEVSVDESGKPQTVRLLSEDVASGFASAAIKAVERARFNPAQVNGEPAPDTIRLRVEFRLQ
jgi:TonB family protein